MNEINDKIKEAVLYCEDALFYLNEAESSVDSAKGWGIFDMIGGGFFSTMIKRGKMREVEENMQKAQDVMYMINTDLEEVSQMLDVNIKTGEFLTFADYFFDGFVVDFLVQGKINEAKTQISDSKKNVEALKEALEKMLEERN